VSKIHNGVCLKEELCFGAERYMEACLRLAPYTAQACAPHRQAIQWTLPFKGRGIEERERRMSFSVGNFICR